MSIKVKKLLKLFIQGNTQDKGKLGGGVKLPCFYGAYGVSGYAYRLRQIGLGHSLFGSGFFKAVFKY